MPVHAFIFPGQGSQAVGMGRDLAAAFAAAREVFQEVDDALGQKLSKLMFEGPAEELTLTENAQPALMAMSLAVLRVLETEGGFALAQQGGASSPATRSANTPRWPPPAPSPLADAARLLKLRGQAMQRAVPAGEGAMAALLGADMAQAAAICAEAARADARPASSARWSSRQRQWRRPGGDLRRTRPRWSGPSRSPRNAACARAMLLPVSAPFHCALMAPAADEMAEALADDHARARRGAGGRQRHRPPRRPTRPRSATCWSQQVTGQRALARERAGDGRRWACDSFVELGAGKVLTGLVQADRAGRRRPSSAGTPGRGRSLR